MEANIIFTEKKIIIIEQYNPLKPSDVWILSKKTNILNTYSISVHQGLCDK